ncbi:hypothetical protein HJFPF1_05156 [Paramyrothecium foliicola]|nr:hypothetical protein HJFPF1_05156 [Paramyrothecium foliicola]
MYEPVSCCDCLRKNQLWASKTLPLYYSIRFHFPTHGDLWFQMDAHEPRPDSPTVGKTSPPLSPCDICHKERVPCLTGKDGRCIRCALLSIQEELKEDTSENLYGPGRQAEQPQQFLVPAVPVNAVSSVESPPSLKRKTFSKVKGDVPQLYDQGASPGPARPMIPKPTPRKAVGKDCPPEPTATSISGQNADQQTVSHGTDSPTRFETDTEFKLTDLNSSQSLESMEDIVPNSTTSAELLSRINNSTWEALDAFNAAATRAATIAFGALNGANEQHTQTAAAVAPALGDAGSASALLTVQMSSIYAGNRDVSNWGINRRPDPVDTIGNASAVHAPGIVAGQNPHSSTGSPQPSDDVASSSSSGASSTFEFHGASFGYGVFAGNTFFGCSPAVWPDYNTTNMAGYLMDITSASTGSSSGSPLSASANADTVMGEYAYGTSAPGSAFEASSGLWDVEGGTGRLLCVTSECKVTFDCYESLREHYMNHHAGRKSK